MPRTLAMVDALLTLDTSLRWRARTQAHQHTHTCYKRGHTKCRFGAPFMPSESTRIVVPFQPLPPLLADDAGRCDSTTEAERVRRHRLKAKYAEMHEALEHGEFANLDEFLRAFDVRSRDEYSEILRAGATRPHVLHARTPADKRVNAFNPWITRVLDSNIDLQIILDHYACAPYVVDYVLRHHHHHTITTTTTPTTPTPRNPTMLCIYTCPSRGGMRRSFFAVWPLLPAPSPPE
ncbi:hypothetical protein HPB49_015135 [Dermacentor silvarum]|uniref:Uncharacterized protein n=1 Tax=Dermacentor silvarum TaxID=543639 RepID=A0ACB8CRX1_DERSI|nr:hypothetical protein HPB49_015135 [Dermacentor silvarum]